MLYVRGTKHNRLNKYVWEHYERPGWFGTENNTTDGEEEQIFDIVSLKGLTSLSTVTAFSRWRLNVVHDFH